ncbi:MAG TPA: cold shock domain-containing protein [Lysobacter sp.]
MRTHGTLSKWNDDRGFGFISPAQGSGEIFVHISAFPRDGIRPRVNELVSFEAETGSDGKIRAIRVMRPGVATPRRSSRRTAPRQNRLGIGAILTAVAIAAIAVYGYQTISAKWAGPQPVQAPLVSTRAVATFKCDGRTMCSQMTSCAEATYFLQHCPNTKMDGNGDGEPCEQQWCN